MSFETHRRETLGFELLDLNDNLIRRIEHASPSCTIEASTFDSLRTGGTMRVVLTGSTAEIDWLRVRVRVLYVDDGAPNTVGTFIPAVPTGPRLGAAGGEMEVQLYDKLLILDDDRLPTTFSLAAGEVVTDVVRALVEDTGEALINIAASAETTSTTSVWDAGTSRLQIINDLLRSIGYFPLRTSREGIFTATPNTPYEQRPLSPWELVDSRYTGIYMDGYRDTQDLFSIPNRWVGVARTDGDVPPLTSEAVNLDPASRFSYPSRGRWITRVSTDVEASSQAALDAIVQRNLTDATSATRIFEVQHAWTPLDLEDLVLLQDFRDPRRPVDSICRVTQQRHDLTVPGALTTSTLREITDRTVTTS